MPNVWRDDHPCNRERPYRLRPGKRHVAFGPKCEACGHEWHERHGLSCCAFCEADPHPDADFEEVPWADSAFESLRRS